MSATAPAAGTKHGKSGGFVASLAVPIGFVAEYREHRKELKQSRSTSDLKSLSGFNGNQSLVEHSITQQSPPEYSEEAPPALPPRPSKHYRVTNDFPEDTFASRDVPGAWTPYGDMDHVEDDEDLWDRDDAAESQYSDESPSELPGDQAVEALVSDVVKMNIERRGTVKHPQTNKGLPFPVIIPQRRPRAKARGFLRAYAPALADCGIDQETFLEFLKNFHKASQASPIFTVVLVAAGVAGNVPNSIVRHVAITCNAAATVGSEIQQRQRTNDFLDRMNEELFQPAGLYAMIIKYKTDLEMETDASGHTDKNLYNMVSVGKVDLTTNQSIAKYNHLSSDGAKTMATRKQNLRVASGVTRGTVDLPEACPLVFPDQNSGNIDEVPDTLKGKMKDASKFLSGYLDRRAQRNYAKDNPDGRLSVPEEQRPYKSKYADPSHPMYASGTFMSFVSGGAIVPSESQIAAKREKALGEDLQLILDGKEPKERYVSRLGDGYYEELYARAAKYKEIALQKDIELISKGSEPLPKQEERYGEGYYEELYQRTTEFREQALQEDVQSIIMGQPPMEDREDVYGKGYNDELWSLTSETRQKSISLDLNTISSGGKPDPGKDLIYGTRYYDELAAQAQKWGMIYHGETDENALTPSISKTSTKSSKKEKESLSKKLSAGNPFNKVRRVIQEDVLYLMIVNLPSKAELDGAMVELEELEKVKAAEKAAQKAAFKNAGSRDKLL